MVQVIVPHAYTAQQRGWSCGAASTRMVLSTFGKKVTEEQMITECRTTTNGTDDINNIRPVLKKHTGRSWARHGMPNDPPSAAQIDLLRRTIAQTIVQERRGLVVNIVAPPSNNLPGYPSYTVWHYLTVMGADLDTDMVYLADPARFGGHEHYWVTLRKLASLIPPKAWAALADVAAPARSVGPLLESRAQLCGALSGYPGWPQLGGRTLTDAIAEILRVLP